MSRIILMSAFLSIGVVTSLPLSATAQTGATTSAPVSSAPATPAAQASSPAAPMTSDTPDVKTVAVENPYGLSALWKGGDAIARLVLIILAVMSLGTWYVMISKYLGQRRILKSSREINKDFWGKGNIHHVGNQLTDGSPFKVVLRAGVSAAQHHHGTDMNHIDSHTWIAMAMQNTVGKLQSDLQTGLAFLGTVGSTAPFVGLFGTVWGIYHALTAIGIAGQASIDKVAGPVGEALIMTAIGLATAVPAVLGYNFLVRRNKVIMDRIRNFASDVHSVLLGGYPAEMAFSDNRAVGGDGVPSTVTNTSRVE